MAKNADQPVSPASATRDADTARRENDIAGADDHEVGAEEIVGPEDETRTVEPDEPSAAQKVKDDFVKRQ